MTSWPAFRLKYWSRTPQGERHKLKAWYTTYRYRNAKTFDQFLVTFMPPWLMEEELRKTSFLSTIAPTDLCWVGNQVVVPFK